MLKLVKHEFLHSMRTFLISFGVFLGACIIFPIVLNVDNINNMPMFSIFFGFSTAFLFIGIAIALFVSIFINYNHSMFQKPGYLTLTLPVSTTEIILSKILVTMLWLIIGCFVLVGGILLSTVISSCINDALTLTEIFDWFASLNQHIIYVFVHETWNLIEMVISIVGILLFTISTIYFSLTVTHTKFIRNHHMLIGVILYFVITFIVEFILSIFFGDIEFMNVYSQMLFIEYVIYLMLGIIFTCGTIYIVEHHIELE